RNGVMVGMSATFSAGDTIAIQLTSASTVETTATTSVTVGNIVSGIWMVTTGVALGDCTGDVAVGTMCQDGTIYVGITPDGLVKMYATACDMGQTWNGSTCTGVRIETSWNDGSIGNDVDTGFTSSVTGLFNTAGLVALGTSPPPAPYHAARFCGNLTVHGHSDWYLPARNELNVMFHASDLGTLSNFHKNSYHSSTEGSSSTAYRQSFNDGYGVNGYKYVSQAVRCVRK
ncbi:MAG: DUF1566 domain-containing protein, partial [Alphaproteobacteria bacterium]|nr:DUF1566 domain-containing protein [Alphaproteobacteria bacterium]